MGGNLGCNVAVVPSSRYVRQSEPLSFRALAKRAASFGELLIGYQERNSIEKTVLNPPSKDAPCIWSAFDLAVLRGDTKVSCDDHEDVGDRLEDIQEEALDGKDDTRDCQAARASLMKGEGVD